MTKIGIEGEKSLKVQSRIVLCLRRFVSAPGLRPSHSLGVPQIFLFLESSLSLCLFILNRRPNQKGRETKGNERKPKSCVLRWTFVRLSVLGCAGLPDIFITHLSAPETAEVSTACGGDHTDQQAGRRRPGRGWRALRGKTLRRMGQ